MIIRRQITSNFTIIPNEAILDARLSAAARWLLVYLLSRPNDWQVQVGDIQKKGGIGREKAYSLIKELIAVGWVRKDISRENGGQWGGVEYLVMDQPDQENLDATPFPEKPYTVEPLPAKQHLTKNLKGPSTEKKINTKTVISYDEDFAEFWAAYPKRPNNSKAAAKVKYILARKRGVSHETIMAGLKEYAAMRNAAVANGDNPHFTKMAETWLNKAGWENDYSVPEGYQVTVQPSVPMASDEDLDAVIRFFPGHVGKREEAKRLLAAEMTGGIGLHDICLAAEKYKLFCKGPPYEDRKTTPSMLEPWLKFKWREMNGYEFCRVGADRIRTVRPIQRKS